MNILSLLFGKCKEVTAKDVASMRSEYCIVDVREKWEWDTCHIKGSLHIPMDQMGSRLNEIPRDKKLAIMCHGGMRSARMVHFLNDKGFENVENMRGGIKQWIATVDSSLQQY